MAYVIAEPCIGVKDAACVAVCPVDCIYEGEAQYYINPDECIDCDACVPECPVEAIYPDDSVPEQWLKYTQGNRSFFEGEPAAEQPAQAVEPAAQGAQGPIEESGDQGEEPQAGSDSEVTDA